MSLREKVLGRLVNLGLSEAEANEVLQLYAGSDAGKKMGDHFNEEANLWPSVVFVPLMEDVRNVAAEWIGKNAPDHEARSAFRPTIKLKAS